MAAVLVILTVAIFITADYFMNVRKERLVVQGAGAAALAMQPGPGAADDPTDLPAGVFVAPGHTWLSILTDGSVKLGPDRFAAWALDGAPGLDLLRQGTKVARGDTLAVLKQGKREVTLRSPIDGTISRVNSQADASSAELSSSWLYQIQPRALSEALPDMRIGQPARSWLRDEVVRFRDMVATLQAGGAAGAVHLADGGFPVRGLAQELDQESWDALAGDLFDTASRQDA